MYERYKIFNNKVTFFCLLKWLSCGLDSLKSCKNIVWSCKKQKFIFNTFKKWMISKNKKKWHDYHKMNILYIDKVLIINIYFDLNCILKNY